MFFNAKDFFSVQVWTIEPGNFEEFEIQEGKLGAISIEYPNSKVFSYKDHFFDPETSGMVYMHRLTIILPKEKFDDPADVETYISSVFTEDEMEFAFINWD